MNTKPIEGSERTLLDGLLRYLAILYRYRWLIIITTCLVTFAAIAFAVISIKLPVDRSPLPNVYTASAEILVQESNQNDLALSLLEALGLTNGGGGPSIQSKGELIVSILKSRAIIEPIVEQFHIIKRYKLNGDVRDKAISIVRKKSTFKYEPSTGIVRISYSDVNPSFSAAVVNRMVSLLGDWFDNNRRLTTEKKQSELEKKIAQVRHEITKLQDQQKSLQEKYGVLSATQLGQSQNALLTTLQAQLLLTEIKIKNYASISRINDPRLEQMKQERQNLVDLIRQTEKGGTGAVDPAGNGTSLASASQQFSQLQLQLDLQQRIYNALLPQLEAVSLSQGPIFQVITLADVPDTKSGPKRSRIVIVGGLVSFFGSVFLALFLNVVREVKKDATRNSQFRRIKDSLVNESLSRHANG